MFQSGQKDIYVHQPDETSGGAVKKRSNATHDRQIQKTQNLLRGALHSLIAERPYDSIVVKEILNRANVGRSTFYMHFQDKDDLLVSGIHEMLGPVPMDPLSAKGHNSFLWFSLPVFEHHYRHAHAWGDKIGTRGRAILHDHLRKVLARVIANAMKKDLRMAKKVAHQIPVEVVSEYVASTFVLVLNWWLDKRMPLSPDEVNDIFYTLTLPTLRAVSG